MASCKVPGPLFLFLGLLVPLLLLVASSRIIVAAAEDVVALTPDTFEDEVGKEKDALVEFYAPWYPVFSFLLSIQLNFQDLGYDLVSFLLSC
jgi:hypothetical protein